MNNNEIGIEINAEYDNRAGSYYSNLINTLILFTFGTEELDKLAGPTFDPLFELETELEDAFTPLLFNSIFRMGLIDISLKNDLLEFKKEVDDVSSEKWDWDIIDADSVWQSIRVKSNELLSKLNIEGRTYDDNSTVIRVG